METWSIQMQEIFSVPSNWPSTGQILNFALKGRSFQAKFSYCQVSSSHQPDCAELLQRKYEMMKETKCHSSKQIDFDRIPIVHERWLSFAYSNI